MLAAITLVSFTSLGLIVLHALLLKRFQFFPACLYILTGDAMAGVTGGVDVSSPRDVPGTITLGTQPDMSFSRLSSYSAPAAHIYMLVLSSVLLLTMLHLCRLVKYMLFGQLRVIEYEHLYEWAWMSASECFLAMTIFRDELDARFVICFAGLMAVKAFHWITRDRIDYMEQTVALQNDFCVRMCTALSLLVVADAFGLYSSISYTLRHGASMHLLFANEFGLLVLSWYSAGIRFVFNWREHRQGHPWDAKSHVLLHIDLVLDFLRLLVYTFFFAVVFSFYGLPLHLIRELYLTAASFFKRWNDVRRYHLAIRTLDAAYPTLSAAEVEALSERTCIVCREDIRSTAGSERAKRLPCAHVFHFRCLRSWLERQQACPTCRRPLLSEDARANNGRPVEVVFQWRALFQREARQAAGAAEAANPQLPPPDNRSSNRLGAARGANVGYPGSSSSSSTRTHVHHNLSVCVAVANGNPGGDGADLNSIHSSLHSMQRQLADIQSRLSGEATPDGNGGESDKDEREVVDTTSIATTTSSSVQEALRRRYVATQKTVAKSDDGQRDVE